MNQSIMPSINIKGSALPAAIKTTNDTKLFKQAISSQTDIRFEVYVFLRLVARVSIDVGDFGKR